MKLNVDAAMETSQKRVGVSVLARDANGALVGSSLKYFEEGD